MSFPTTHLGSRVVPALLVRDLEEALAFWERLGFETTGRFPDASPTWAEVTRDGVVFQFHTRPPHGTPPEPICSGTFYVHPDDVRALADEWREHVPFAWGPGVMDYGMREFAIQDPSGYYFAFAEPAS